MTYGFCYTSTYIYIVYRSVLFSHNPWNPWNPLAMMAMAVGQLSTTKFLGPKLVKTASSVGVPGWDLRDLRGTGGWLNSQCGTRRPVEPP